MKFKLPIIFTLALFLFTTPLHANPKADFWETRQKGTNWFNETPDSIWLDAAKELGVTWVRLTFARWDSNERDFLMGNADQYKGLVKEDLAKLTAILDEAAKRDIKIVVTPLGLPGKRWTQNNGGKQDLRLFEDKAYWAQAAQYWQDLATALKDHPAVVAYNIINEPNPEYGTGLAEHGDPARFTAWYAKHKDSAKNLPALYETIIDAIRDVDTLTPIMLDAGWYAQPAAFSYWPKMKDKNLLYGFHMYEPYAFTSPKNFKRKPPFKYPGTIPFAEKEMAWSKETIRDYLTPIFTWAKANGIPENRIVAAEFGCYRRNPGAKEYLTDVLSVLNEKNLHWAFYSFREDAWDGYDYEVGTGPLGWKYWQAVEAGKKPVVPRKKNPLFDVIKGQFP